MTSHKEHAAINASLVDGWYGKGEPRESRAIELALDFIVESPYTENAMIVARNRIRAALTAPVEDRVSWMEAGEKALLSAHVDALLYIRQEESRSDCEWIAKRAKTVEEGEYLYEYGEGTNESTSMPLTMGDDVADELREQLRARGFDWETDDTGWLVKQVQS